MHLNKEQYAAFDAWLKAKAVKTQCPMCGDTKDMRISPSVCTFHDQSTPSIGARFVVVGCEHCGATQFFSAKHVGI
jgi:hypothetical protein